MIDFGAGVLFVNPNAGNLAANPTPGQVLTLQDVSIDISQDLKELRGATKWPEDIAPADMKGSGKFGTGRIDQQVFNNIFFANASTTGIVQAVQGEAGTIPSPSGPYTITVVNSANFAEDFGVQYASGTGGAGAGRLTRVASGPTQGQYSVASGVYTFAAADAGTAVLISYSFTAAAVGTTVSVINENMGFGPQFELFLMRPYQQITISSKVYTGGLRLYCCRASKLGQEKKRDGYTIPALEFQYFANPVGKVMDLFDPGI
jgi:hypothetical protein